MKTPLMFFIAVACMLFSLNTAQPKHSVTTLPQQTYMNVADSVYICDSPNAYAYHNSYCQGLRRCTYEVKKVSKQDAIDGHWSKPCGYCY